MLAITKLCRNSSQVVFSTYQMLRRPSTFNNKSIKAHASTAVTSDVRLSEDPTIPHGKIYELRTYSLRPKDAKEFSSITEELFHLRTKHSKLVGFWTSELGGLSEVVHLWEYENYAHRAKVRKALASDSDWQNMFLKKVSPMWSKQKNSTMMLMPWSELTKPSQPGIYELQIFHMNNHTPVWNDRLFRATNLHSDFLKPYSSVLVGTFLTIFGYHNTVIVLWQHKDVDISSLGKLFLLSESNKSVMMAFYHEVQSAYTKILIPHKVSPLQ